MNNQESFDVLLVEDNAQDAEMIRWALKKLNLAERILTLTDGAQAVEFLFGKGIHAERNTEARPKVIFLDLKLPSLDGIEVLKKIKGDEKMKMIPVVVLTSSHERRDLEDSYRLGVNSYVVKPVSSDLFDKSVREMGSYWMSLNRAPA